MTHFRSGRSSRYATAIAIALATVLASCSGSALGKSDPSDVALTVDIYSGRPNPSFQLSAEEVAELSEIVEASRAETTGLFEIPDVSRVGFRGLLIEPLVVDGDAFYLEIQYPDFSAYLASPMADRESERVFSEDLKPWALEVIAERDPSLVAQIDE